MLIKETFIDDLLAEELNKVIIHCEWFDKNNHNKKNATHQMKDLCMHCIKSPHCLLPKAKSGVWKCEEYS